MSVFAELESLCPALAISGVVAPEALKQEPLSALEELELLGERLIRYILAFEGLQEPNSAAQMDRLNILSNRGFLPPILLPFFQVLNGAGQRASMIALNVQMHVTLVLKQMVIG